MTKKQKETFIKDVAKAVQELAPEYGIKVCSPIIAQCIIESGWGESRLSKEYNNFFGIKAGTSWKGKSVDLQTNEEYEPGNITTITDAFRVYENLKEGVRGYFELIQLPRYANLKGVTDPETYARLIKQDGYATDSKYADTIIAVIRENELTRYDKAAANVDKEIRDIVSAKTADDYLAVWRSWVGYNEVDGSFQEIIDTYNGHTPRARGYAVRYNDEWCDTTVSAAAIKAGMVDLIGTECSCEEHVSIFKEKGIWIEDGTITPKPGYIIVFSWRASSQPNNAFSDHIGVVAAVENGIITTIEGNKNECVGYRSIPVGWEYIRGYAAPKYGEGEKMESKAVVSSKKGVLGKNPQYEGVVTASLLNVRSWAGTEYANIKSYPTIRKGTIVEVCDSLPAHDGTDWYYIRISKQVYGFVSARYISKL